MSQYTTGEMARQCGVSVRTVQFYDAKDLLHPSELSEGGRRLYSDGDLAKLRLICLLKSFGLSLDSIRGILESEAPDRVLLVLLDEQAGRLEEELSEMQRQKNAIAEVRRSIRSGEIKTVDSICDMERTMNGRKKLRKVYATMLIAGILMDIAEVGSILLWIFRGVWWPFAVVMPLVVLGAVLLVRMYYRHAAYICPACNARFQPKLREFFFANHTLRTRKLTCTACGHKDWCVETSVQEA